MRAFYIEYIFFSLHAVVSFAFLFQSEAILSLKIRKKRWYVLFFMHVIFFI